MIRRIPWGVWFLLAVSFAGTMFVGCGPSSDSEKPAASIPATGKEQTRSSQHESSDLATVRVDLEARRQGELEQRRRQLHPKVVIRTNMGEIPVVLNREEAPQTVDNFLDHAKRGFYDQTLFHQVFQGYAIIGGLMDTDFEPKNSLGTVRNEARNGLRNRRGTIAMLRDPAVIDSATTQFFINLNDNPELDYQGWDPDDPNADPADYGYCVFGEVTPEGMEVVDRIAQVRVHDTDEFPSVPEEPVIIESIQQAD